MQPERRQRRVSRVLQFLIVLVGTDPLVWRRIQVPAHYSFWDLHVAIQDAMGWQDSHLHEFTVANVEAARVFRLGIPDEDFPDVRPCIPDWTAAVSEYIRHWSAPALYV